MCSMLNNTTVINAIKNSTLIIKMENSRLLFQNMDEDYKHKCIAPKKGVFLSNLLKYFLI